MNPFFSFSRFKHLFIRDIFVNLRYMVSTIISVFTILSLLFYLALLFNDSSYDIITNFSHSNFTLAFLAAGIFISGNAFRDFRNKERKMSYLMLPSSTFEKFLSQYVLISVVFTILTLLAYYLFSFFNMAIVATFTKHTMPLELPLLSKNIIPLLRFYIPIQLILLAGAATFQKKPLFFTGLLSFVFILINSLIIVAVLNFVFKNVDNSARFALNDNMLINIHSSEQFLNITSENFYFLSFKLMYWFYQYILSILALVFTWFSIKEKQA